ncbi:Holliday junction resolvase RuvX [Stomatohabitans albus]|uniref:Holliday junction resolvase RuvX n=1 Tax=Stomatohabitans albus TaxID=3110766 RepID=UPI00300CA85C
MVVIADRPGRVMGIDPGTVRLGIALSDPDRLVATGHAVVPGGDDAPQAIAKIAQDQQVRTIIVGWPRGLSGEETPASLAARDLADKLQGLMGPDVHVELMDERFSSRQADRGPRDRPRLSAKKQRAKRASGERDMAAAQVILASWLEQSHTGEG